MILFKKRQVDSLLRKERTRLQAEIMLSFSAGKTVQILADNGSWLNCNGESGFGCGWDWTKKVYRIKPDEDTAELNKKLTDFYIFKEAATLWN